MASDRFALLETNQGLHARLNASSLPQYFRGGLYRSEICIPSFVQRIQPFVEYSISSSSPAKAVADFGESQCSSAKISGLDDRLPGFEESPFEDTARYVQSLSPDLVLPPTCIITCQDLGISEEETSEERKFRDTVGRVWSIGPTDDTQKALLRFVCHSTVSLLFIAGSEETG